MEGKCAGTHLVIEEIHRKDGDQPEDHKINKN